MIPYDGIGMPVPAVITGLEDDGAIEQRRDVDLAIFPEEQVTTPLRAPVIIQEHEKIYAPLEWKCWVHVEVNVHVEPATFAGHVHAAAGVVCGK